MEDRRTALARVLGSPSRVELLHHLQRSGPSLVADLARATGLHTNTAREHLAVLAEIDLVRSEPEVRHTRGRPRLIYRATSTADVMADPDATRRFDASIAQAALVRALVEGFGASTATDEPDGAAAVRRETSERAETAGVSAGRSLPAVAAHADHAERGVLALEAHLDSFGFDPEFDGEALTFHLWRCPFLELAQQRPEVVCHVHAGLAQGVLERAGGDLAVEALTPFVGPGHCTLTLRRGPRDPASRAPLALTES